MNNKKKIIDTLRSADKASVEKLMAEEAKKNEIFAKAQRRANINQSEYTYSVSGVEKLERRINMTRMISIAATVVLMTGFVGGGAYLMTNNKAPKHPEHVTQQSETDTTATNTTATITTFETEDITRSIVDSVITTADLTVPETTIAANTEETTEATTEEQSDKITMTKEELIEKTKNENILHCFDKFSADYTIIRTEFSEYRTEPETYTGKLYLDEVNMTASGICEDYVNDKLIRKQFNAVKDKKSYNAEEAWSEIDFKNGGYKFLETPNRTYYVNDETEDGSDKVYIYDMNRIVFINETEEWDITGEKNENGRRIVSISGIHKGNDNFVGDYRETTYKGEIDAATGMTLSYKTYDESGKMTYSYELTNYKFDDDAEEFRTASDIISEIENGGYINSNMGY